ncbi:AEC family transporter [Acinetobacter qingfengensis]|uniref:Transporter n=1 Tax=Acinetobacter qingfengensis TaxID=1262585 RepID=A0A1E7RFK4_9GAMM|nr:AEC family transporter [Acinetobacter qingfengensis]KAA8732786.1 AEC family transporter [Acinetobacter qingfengensis]OEY98101.1 transporter [Acinetobacter qingfengensis]
MVLQVILPLLLLMSIGYLCAYFKVMTKEHFLAMNTYVIKIALPAFLLYALSSKNINELWHPAYFIAYGGGSLILFFLAYFLYWRVFDFNVSQAAVMSMGASMSNTGFMGTAILTLLIGTHAAIYISLTLIIENILIVLLMLTLAELGKQQGALVHIFLQTLKKVFKNPLIIAIVLGLFLAILDLHLPKPVFHALELLGKTASPVALFVIGGSLAMMPRIQINLPSMVLVIFSVILMPLLVYGIFHLFPDVSREMLYAGTLLAALPMPTAFGIFGQAYGLHEKALTPLMISTVLGFIGVSSLIYFWY